MSSDEMKCKSDAVHKLGLSISPRRALIMCAQSNDWLYPPLMRLMRERFGTTFFLICAPDRIDWFRSACGEGDVVISVTEDGPAFPSSCNLEPSKVYAEARSVEGRYGVTYLRDIVQQDRSIATIFLNNAPNSTFRESKNTNAIETVEYISRCFEYYEAFLAREKFDLLINRPAGISDIVMSEVAIARGIPVTFFHGSYFGAGAQWAAGAYMGDQLAREVYDRTPDQVPVPRETLLPSATWTKPPAPTLRSLARALLVQTVIYAQFWLGDLKRFQRTGRVPYLTNIRSQIRQYEVQRYLHGVGETDLDKIAALPFVYVALPHEPEFTVQSLCREFADTTAWFRQLALSLPAGYRLVLKEHQRIGHRAIEYYESFRRFPNIIIAHPSLRGVDLMARCAATATMGGSTPAEAALFGKPSVVFGTRNPYSFLPSVTIATNPGELPLVMREVLRERGASETDRYQRAGARFRKAIERLSFDATGTRLFRHGTKSDIGLSQVEKALETLCISIGVQHSAAASLQQNRRIDANV